MSWKESEGRMSMLADVIDVVVGGDTHRDTHALEIATPAGAVIATTEHQQRRGRVR